MGFLSVVHSDTGIHKDMNQDAVLIKEAETDYGKVMLAVVCDGMGGLSRGEVASAALIRAFSDWFETRFPDLLYTRRTEEGIERSRLELELDGLVQDMNGKIQEYSRKFHGKMGTTAALLLMAEGNYYTMNVGDSRVYRITSDTVSRLTTDQTVVQKDIELGWQEKEEGQDLNVVAGGSPVILEILNTIADENIPDEAYVWECENLSSSQSLMYRILRQISQGHRIR